MPTTEEALKQSAQSKEQQTAAPSQLPSQNNTMMKRISENISTQVLDRVSIMQKAGEITLPKGYEVGNALKSAWLYLQTVETRTKQRAIDVCTKDSIANCLLEMVVKGEHPMQHCYFIPTGNTLSFWERYTGKLMRAKRDTDIKEVNPQVVYDGDTFVYTVDSDGLLQLVKHETNLANMDNSKIVGAYAVVINKDGSHHLEVMTMDMIRKAWQQGAAKGTSGAHTNFTDQMAKKTIIGRACKIALDSTEDGHNDDSDDEGYMAPPSDAEAEREAANDTSRKNRRIAAKPAVEHHDDFEEAAQYEEMPDDASAATPSVEEQELQAAAPATTPKHGRACPI
jgi:recombination protein RecT